MQFAHPGLADPEYYVAGLPADYVAARYGIDPSQISKLGSAENPFGASPKAIEAVNGAIGKLHLYPAWTAQASAREDRRHVRLPRRTRSCAGRARPR